MYTSPSGGHIHIHYIFACAACSGTIALTGPWWCLTVHHLGTTHTHTHTHVHTRTHTHQYLYLQLSQPKQGVNKQETTRLLITFQFWQWRVQPYLYMQVHGPLSAVGTHFMGLQDPWHEGGGVQPSVTASEYPSKTLGHTIPHLYTLQHTHTPPPPPMQVAGIMTIWL